MEPMYMVSNRVNSDSEKSWLTRTGAPETDRPDDQVLHTRLRIGALSDIFSLGGVFSEVIVWATYRWTKVQEYRKHREDEIRRKSNEQGSYRFHNGIEILDEVSYIHRCILENDNVDKSTKLILKEVIMGMMLQVEVNQRASAHSIYERFGPILQQAGRLALHPVPFTSSYDEQRIDENRLLTNRRITPPQLPPHLRPPSLQTVTPFESPFGVQLTEERVNAAPDDGHTRVLQESHSSPFGYHTPYTRTSVYGNPLIEDFAGMLVSDQNDIASSTGPKKAYMSVSDGLNIKRRKKGRERIPWQGDENLVSLNKRDHVRLTRCRIFPSLITVAQGLSYRQL